MYRFSAQTAIGGRRVDVGNDRYLQLALDAFSQADEVRRMADSGKFSTWRDSHISLEWDVILEEVLVREVLPCDTFRLTSSMAAAICTWLSGPKIVTTSEAVSLSGKRT